MYGWHETHTKPIKHLKGRNHLGEASINGKTILKSILNQHIVEKRWEERMRL